MAAKNYTLQELLSLKKRLRAQLVDFTRPGGYPLIGTAQGLGAKQVMLGVFGGKNVEQAQRDMTGNLQRLEALQKNLNAVEQALINANSTTQVTVGGETMAIAAAVYRRKNILPLQQSLLADIARQLVAANNEFNAAARTRDQKVDQALSSMGQGNAAADASSREAQANITNQMYQPTLIDPNGLGEKHRIAKENFDKFSAEFDSALAQINATTSVELDLDD